MNIAGNSTSSSLLPMLDSHVRAAPESAYIGTETVRLTALDKACAGWITASDRIFLKIDVQGVECQVLQGAKQTLPQIIGIQVELSLVPLYEDQVLYDVLWDTLVRNGFELWNIFPGLTERCSGRLLQFDGVLCKT